MLAAAVPARSGQVMSGSNPDPAFSALQLWLKADAGVAAAGDGQPIVAWTNQATSPFASGNATTFSIGASNAPTLVLASSVLHGQAAVGFNGTNQGLDISDNLGALLANSSYTVFAVAETAGANTASTWHYVQMIVANNYNTIYLYSADPWIGAPLNQYLNQFTIQNNSFGNWAVIHSSSTITNHTGYVLSATCVGTNTGGTRLYLNGLQDDNRTAEAVFSLGTGWSLGYQPGNSRWFHGQIAELLIYQGALAESDRLLVTAYLGNKYGVNVPSPAVAVPTNHPPPGIYFGQQSVTISSEAGATIYYTVDGSNPTNSATRLSGLSPIAGVIVPAGTNFTILAYATKPGASASAVAKSIYNTVSTNTPTTIVSEVRALANGKRVLYVDGAPWQIYGGQMRVDTWRLYVGYNNAQMAASNIFTWPVKLNMNVVQVPIYWGDIERAQNQFDWTNLKWAMDQCWSNGLRMEVLWFGSDIAGRGGTSIQPGYILNDSGTYPLMVSSNGLLAVNQTAGADGFEYTVCKEYASTIAAEANAIFNLMEYLRLQDTNHVVVGMLVEDEPSLTINASPKTDRCYCPLCNELYIAGGYTNSLEFCKHRLAVHLDRMATPVKLSPHQIATHVNWVDHYSNYDEDVGITRALAPHVDFIGWDPYGMSQAQRYAQLVGDLSSASNMPFVCEEPGGQDGTCREKIIDTFAANGGGCEFYRVDTYSTNAGVDNYLINPDGTDARPWTDSIRQTFGMLRKVMCRMAVLAYTNAPDTPIQYFNSFGNTITQYRGTNWLKGAPIQYTTSGGGVGIAFADGPDTVLMSAKGGSFKINDGPGVVENGYYDTQGNWVSVSPHSATKNSDGTLRINLSSATPYEVVKFRIVSHLSVTLVNGGNVPTAGSGFSVSVQAQAIDGTPLAVTNDTVIVLSLKSGSGILGGTLSGTIAAGQTGTILSAVTYDKAESGVAITAVVTGGESLLAADTAAFTVQPPIVIGNCQLLADGRVQLTFSGAAGSSFRILYTRVLSAPLGLWSALTQGVFSAQPATFIDSGPTNRQNFYRIVSP